MAACNCSKNPPCLECREIEAAMWKEGEVRMENIGRNANEGEHYRLSDEIHNYVEGQNKRTTGEASMTPAAYLGLQSVLDRAFHQAAFGKGAERHAQAQAFEQQPMQKLIDLYGVGFALGQAGKKMQESQRLEHDAAIRELLGAIVYIAGAIVHKEANHGR